MRPHFFFQLLPVKTLKAKANKYIGGKSRKNHIMVLICSNRDVSDKQNLLIIGKSKKSQGFNKRLSMPVTYVSNAKAWMTRDIFNKFLANFDNEMAKAKSKVMLLLHNCTAHPENEHLSAVEVLFLPPNTTAKLQLMDKGVIANFNVYIGHEGLSAFWSTFRPATALPI